MATLQCAGAVLSETLQTHAALHRLHHALGLFRLPLQLVQPGLHRGFLPLRDGEDWRGAGLPVHTQSDHQQAHLTKPYQTMPCLGEARRGKRACGGGGG